MSLPSDSAAAKLNPTISIREFNQRIHTPLPPPFYTNGIKSTDMTSIAQLPLSPFGSVPNVVQDTEQNDFSNFLDQILHEPFQYDGEEMPLPSEESQTTKNSFHTNWTNDAIDDAEKNNSLNVNSIEPGQNGVADSNDQSKKSFGDVDTLKTSNTSSSSSSSVYEKQTLLSDEERLRHQASVKDQQRYIDSFPELNHMPINSDNLPNNCIIDIPQTKRHVPESTSSISLTDGQKRLNHIASEKKRRLAIRQGFDTLMSLVPSMARQRKASLAGQSQKELRSMNIRQNIEDRQDFPIELQAPIMLTSKSRCVSTKSEAYILKETIMYIKQIRARRDELRGTVRYLQSQRKTEDRVVT